MAKRVMATDLKMGALYFSRDNLLFLSTFFCSTHRDLDLNNTRIAEKVKHAKDEILKEFPDAGEAVDQYISNLDNDYVMYATASRLAITFRMVRHMLDHQGAHTFLDCFENSPLGRLTLGLKNVSPSELLEPVLNLLHRYDFNVGRAFLIRFEKGYNESVTVMCILLFPMLRARKFEATLFL